LMCYPDGGIVDDIIIYRVSEENYFVCVNASNITKDFDWITQPNAAQATMIDRSNEYALIAVQGPTASGIVQRLTPLNLTAVKRYWFTTGEVAGVPALIARTGYTGEDGFELFVAADHAVKVWNACLDAGQSGGILPIGLGARDTLRLEAAYMLYGNDIDAQTTPLEAGLQRLVRFEKPAFIGRDALLQQQATGIRKQFVGLSMDEAGIPRHGYSLWHAGQQVGVITSGTQSPSLGVGIALGYVPPVGASVGTPLTVEIRGRQVRAHVVARPFYRKG
jgi:aminomethyltransferase